MIIPPSHSQLAHLFFASAARLIPVLPRTSIINPSPSGQAAHVEPDMSNSPPNPRAAYFEEYNEEAHTTIPETRQTANVAAKRSKPDITKLKVAQDEPDDSSDSGNSNPSLSPGESENVDRGFILVNPPSLKIDTSATALKSKPRDGNRQIPGTSKKAQKPTLRRVEPKDRDGQSADKKVCNCKECQAKKVRRPATIRKTSRPSENPAVPPLLRTKPEAPTPPSPFKPPAPQPIQVPIVQPAQVRPRATATQTYRSVRPMSFHAGAMPEYLYTQPVFIERRPGPTFPTGLSFPPPSFTPPKPLYFPPSLPSAPPRQEMPPPMSPFPFEPLPQSVPLPHGRPQPRHWISEQPPPPRQPMLYGTSPIVEYPGQPIYPMSNPNPQQSPRRSFNQRDRPAPLPEETFIRDEGYYQMPPPPRPDGTQQYRPTFRHTASTSAVHPTLHHTRSRRGEENPTGLRGERSPRKTSPEKREQASRPPLASRPSAASGNERPALYATDRNTARVRVESSAAAKQNRRASYYGYETSKDLERVVEAYQALKIAESGHPLPDLTSDSLKLVRKKTQSSDTGSRNSVEGKRSREGSDVKPRSSMDRRGGSDVKSRTDTDGFTMRFPPGVNVDFTGGGVEGTTISLRQSGEGEGGMEVSIGNRGRNSASRNETRDRSRKRNSYIEDGGAKELEYSRSVSRVPRAEREVVELAGERERKVAGSRSRRSSRTGYRESRGFFG